MEDFKYLVIFLTDVIVDGLDDNIVFAYANVDNLIEIGLDPNRDMDIHIDIDRKLHYISINLYSKYGEQYKDFVRDLNLRKILDDFK